MLRTRWIWLAGSLLLISGTVVGIGAEYLSGIIWTEPPVVDPGPVGGPPSDAVVLFDGSSLSQWEGGERWIVRDGYATPMLGDIKTKQLFGDCQLHIEFATPAEVRGEGQGRGNSGVFLADRYEVQVLDSYENKTYFDGQAGALYKTRPPLVNACRKPGEWQAYDIIFQAPRFDEHGQLLKPAYITVLHNGVLVQNHLELLGDTVFDKGPKYTPHGPGPIRLQYHGDPVRFRNIWVRAIPEPTPKYPG